jgi:hypothetical protein
LLVRGIQREIDKIGAQATEIEEKRLGGFFHLHSHAIAGHETLIGEKAGITGRNLLEIAIRKAPPSVGFNARTFKMATKPFGKQAVKIAVHARQ